MGKRKEATMEKLYENLANHLRRKVVEQSNLQNELLACSYVLVHVILVWMLPSLLPCCAAAHTVFPHIRPAGTIFSFHFSSKGTVHKAEGHST